MQPPRKVLHRSGIIFCLLLCTSALSAQKIIHFEDIGFEEAIEKAKAQKKIVFVDVRGMNANSYTDKVDKDIFTLDSIADFFNEHCISIRIQMNSEEGKKFAPRLAMLMYPVYVFHGSNGDQLDFTNAGSVSKDPGVLMQKARSSLAINKMKNSNTRAITFAKGSWQQILQLAKSQKKLIFLDAYTTWCRPCIMMARDIFTLDRVADFYNGHFINVSMDMEKGDGPPLTKKYGINAYPTFLYIDGDGNLVHQDGGYQEADRFLKNGQSALDKSATAAAVIPFAGSVVPFAGSQAPANAPDTGMHFTTGTWASLLARSRQSGQLIFVDANTSWCGPCKEMRREIFPQKAVGELYDSHFINVDLDMEKGEGITFRKQYGIKAYPTFLYINGRGEVVHKTVGSCDAAAFRRHALDALDPRRNLLYLQKNYSVRKNDESFVATYLAVLKDAYEMEKADSVAVTFLLSRSRVSWQQPACWFLVKEYVDDATSPVFRALVKAQPAYAQRYGVDEVEKKIYDTYLAWPQHYLHFPQNGKAQLDRQPFDNFLRQVRESDYGKKAEVEARSKLTVDFGLNEWTDYATTVDGMLSAKIIPMDAIGAEWLYSFADNISRFSGDNRHALSAATGWTKLISTGIAGVNPANKATYLDLYAALLDKTGQSDLAGEVRRKIDRGQLDSAKKNAPFQMLMRIVPKQNQPVHAGEKVYIDTEKPRAGQAVSFHYAASGGMLEGSKEVHGTVFFYTARKATGYYALDVAVSPDGTDRWKGGFTVPDSAVAFGIRLKSGKNTENNDGKGNISLVYDEKGVRPGGYAGAALLFANGEYLFALPNHADTAIALLEKEFTLHPEQQPNYIYAWFYNLAGVKKQDAYPLVDKKAMELLSAPDAPETDYKLAMRLFQLEKKKKPADSVLRLAAEKFPGSELAAQYDENGFYAIRDLDSQVMYYNNYRQKYPQQGPQDAAVQASSYFAASISSRYLEKKDYRQAIGFAARMNDGLSDYRGFMYSRIASDLVKNDNETVLADSLLQTALTGLENELAHPEKFRPQGMPEYEWKEGINSYYAAAVYDTYGRILAQQGDYRKALERQQQALKLSGEGNNTYNEHYIKYLAMAGDTKAAMEKSAIYIKIGNASDSVRTWFKEFYIKEQGSDKGYDTCLAGLEASAKEKIREDAIKEKMDLPSKSFSIPDIDGNTVSLESLKGKVIIVDFWATWCGPCKASFPAMQKTVDKYKNDSNVVFLFVDTWESIGGADRLTSVKKFIQDNKYTFKVLLDKAIDLEKRQYSVVSDYGVGGIPTKFVISPQGKIVFKAIGFDGNDEKLVDELSAYIDLAKG